MFLPDDDLLKSHNMLQQYICHIHLVVSTAIYIIIN